MVLNFFIIFLNCLEHISYFFSNPNFNILQRHHWIRNLNCKKHFSSKWVFASINLWNIANTVLMSCLLWDVKQNVSRNDVCKYFSVLKSTLNQVIFWHYECISSKVYLSPPSLHIFNLIFLISWEALTDVREEKI